MVFVGGLTKERNLKIQQQCLFPKSMPPLLRMTQRALSQHFLYWTYFLVEFISVVTSAAESPVSEILHALSLWRENENFKSTYAQYDKGLFFWILENNLDTSVTFHSVCLCFPFSQDIHMVHKGQRRYDQGSTTPNWLCVKDRHSQIMRDIMYRCTGLCVHSCVTSVSLCLL